MATRLCTYCGQTFGNDGNTVGKAIIAGCTHAGYLRSIAVQQQGIILSFPSQNQAIHPNEIYRVFNVSLLKLELLIKYPGIIFVFWVMSTPRTV